jgi:predicted metal-dependent hydrolase
VVDASGVELVVPPGIGEDELQDWLRSRTDWVDKALADHRAARAAIGRVDLRDGGAVPYLGDLLELSVRNEEGRARPAVMQRGDRLNVRLPHAARATTDLRAALERWYRRRARDEVARRLDDACARHAVSYERLAIRGQRSRWASCSPTGTMSFNWRLLLAPAAVLDYVVEHEVAHLDVPDHSRRFWSLLAERRPGYREQEAWLRRYGRALYL